MFDVSLIKIKNKNRLIVFGTFLMLRQRIVVVCSRSNMVYFYTFLLIERTKSKKQNQIKENREHTKKIYCLKELASIKNIFK